MASEPSVFYYIAFVALQAFLTSLKQKRYGTDAGENKCILTMVLFPPLWLTATHLFGLLLVWRNLRKYLRILSYDSNVLHGNDLQLNLFICLFLTETSCNGSQKLILRRQDSVPRGLLFER